MCESSLQRSKGINAHSKIFATANGDRWALIAEDLADMLLKAGYEEKSKSLKNIALRASSEIASGAAVRYGKMVVVARRENEG